MSRNPTNPIETQNVEIRTFTVQSISMHAGFNGRNYIINGLITDCDPLNGS